MMTREPEIQATEQQQHPQVESPRANPSWRVKTLRELAPGSPLTDRFDAPLLLQTEGIQKDMIGYIPNMLDFTGKNGT